MDELKKLRQEIDEIDKSLVELFEKRMKVVLEIGRYKIKNNLPVLNVSREKQVIEKNANHLKNTRLKGYLEKFFNNLMNISKEIQKDNFKKV